MENVKRFANDKHLVQDVLNETISYLEKKIVEEAYAGTDVSATAKAKKVIQNAFNHIVNEYGVKEVKKSVNENV